MRKVTRYTKKTRPDCSVLRVLHAVYDRDLYSALQCQATIYGLGRPEHLSSGDLIDAITILTN